MVVITIVRDRHRRRHLHRRTIDRHRVRHLGLIVTTVTASVCRLVVASPGTGSELNDK